MDLKAETAVRKQYLYEMEPVGGFERSVCRLQFGCSAIKLHRRLLIDEIVPCRSDTNSCGNDTVRKNAHETPM